MIAGALAQLAVGITVAIAMTAWRPRSGSVMPASLRLPP